MKIVHVVAPTTAGGLERVVESLAVGFHRRGHDVTVVTLLLGGETRHPFVDALAAAGVSPPCHTTSAPSLPRRAS